MAVKNKYIFPAVLAAFMAFSASAQILPDDGSKVDRPWNRDIERLVSTGAAYTVSGSDLDRFAATDFRTLLNAVFPGLFVNYKDGYNDYAGSIHVPWLYTDRVAVNARIGNSILCLLDDVPTPLSQVMLDPSQIESLTLLHSVLDKNSVGPLGCDGILMIRTRKGKYNQKIKTEVFVESGAAVSGKEPEWVSGSEYASLNNFARTASGYTPLYEDPKAYDGGDPYSLTFPNVDYKSLMIKNVRNYSRAGVNVSGGSDIINYSVSLNGAHEDGYWKLGPADDYNRINASSQINAKIGKWIRTSAGFVGSVNLFYNNRISYANYRTVPAIAYPLIVGRFEGDDSLEETIAEGTPMYGVSTTFGDNYYAKLVDGGFKITRSRNGIFNAGIDVDLGWILKGFHSRTYAYLGTSNLITLGKNNDYLAYLWSPSEGVGQMSTSHRGVKATGRGQDGSAMIQTLAGYETLSYDLKKDGHQFYADLTFNIYDARLSGLGDSRRQAQMSFTSNYSYKQRYAVDLSLNYAGSMIIPARNRYRLFPAAGLAWIASNEPFLKDAEWLNLLKIRAQVGEMGANNIFGTKYLYESRYTQSSGRTVGPTSTGQWFGNETRTTKYTTVSRLANPDLDWEVRRQADIGLEAHIFDRFRFIVDGYYHRIDGIITEISAEVPDSRGLNETSYYDNYNVRDFRGVDATFQYSDHAGDFRWSLGATASYMDARYVKVANDYSTVPYAGTRMNSYRGFICLGKFTSDEEIASSPLYGTTTRIGDLKYKDVNEDGIIDSKDEVIIGESVPRLRYSVSLSLAWKNLDFSIQGTGIALGDVALTNAWFWNGWGDGNYSAFVRDNLGGDYPNLSYVKSDNNFVQSTFWLRKSDYFKIKNAELGYNIPVREGNRLKVSGVRVALRGTNLFSFSGLETVEPENINAGVGVEPLCSYYTGVLKFTF